jgi:pimeloyl-ACP methyl ester carboxylesterase
MISSPHVLFLHGGPGFSAELERRRFREQLPVHWWDQPRIKGGASTPFATLVDATIFELERLVALRGTRISLLASSFGTRVACAVLARAPHLIDTTVMLAGALELRTAFVRLGLAIARRRADAELAAAAHDAARSDTSAGYWDLLGKISTVPRFHDVYWGPAAEEQRAAMSRLADERGLFDAETLQAVVNELLWVSQPPLPAESPPVRVLLGRHDPLFDESDLSAWHAVLPRAMVEIVDAGHFPHLELPPEVWLPPSPALPPEH